eukprot:CAMPEP_0178599610 /NCGR_PEP_ID=MMETSP0697-20121206/33414_1 /TAXON_ID=265572 /ORGANISM="Extubocellulus spinifer, Strain CCMP396" /LENGTH=240 /DNA_ID=CAMNT_0020237549 /DNA_START=17 /DNA_END=735 /DNA_ORIENTATION=-
MPSSTGTSSPPGGGGAHVNVTTPDQIRIPPSPSPDPNASILRDNLAGGFASLASTRNHRSGASPSSSGARRQGSRQEDDVGGKDNVSAATDAAAAPSAAASISFIDPSTPATTIATPATTSTTGKDATTTTTKRVTGLLKNDHEKGLNLYEKVSTILERDYNTTLHGVPYTNLRTGAAERVDVLPVRPFLSGGAAAAGGGGGSGSSSSDPSEWHNGPYCHVYLAACRDLDHYRSKVRPSL